MHQINWICQHDCHFFTLSSEIECLICVINNALTIKYALNWNWKIKHIDGFYGKSKQINMQTSHVKMKCLYIHFFMVYINVIHRSRANLWFSWEFRTWFCISILVGSSMMRNTINKIWNWYNISCHAPHFHHVTSHI